MESNFNIQNFATLAKSGNAAGFQHSPAISAPLNDVSLKKPPEKDEFVQSKQAENVGENNPKDKKKSNKGKIIAAVIGAGGVLAAGAAYLFLTKHFKPAHFKEAIKFKEAATMDEAVNFAKKNFGVETFDFKDDLEFANWVNEGLTNINNRFRGKANMPKTLAFTDIDDDTLAFASSLAKEIKFNEKKLTNKALLEDFLQKTDGYFETITEGGKTILRAKKSPILVDPDKYKELMMLWHKADRARNGGKLMSRKDLLSAIFKYEDCFSVVNNPEGALYSLLENKEMAKLLKKKGIKVDLEKFLSLDQKEQRSYIAGIYKKAGRILKITGEQRNNSPFDILYHEMGHYQHYGNRNFFDDFFGKLSKRSAKKFLKDKRSQKIAGKVSWYAKTDPKEFVAETFSAMAAGKKMPKEVMELYEYYKGPLVPAA